VRTALGVRTVFNLLGPLTNPGAPRYLLVGAFDAAAAELIAGSLSGIPLGRAWVVHGAAGWDEATPMGPFIAFDVTPGAVRRYDIDPLTLGLERCTADDLKGGDAKANALALRDVFAGRDRGPHRSALLLQAGLALHIAGRADSVAQGLARAAQVLDSGAALRWLGELEHFAADVALGKGAGPYAP
jgi:anthranilate phosphoribosyltransferase